MFLYPFITSFLLCSFLFWTANAGPFGIKSKENKDEPAINEDENGNHPLVDLSDDELMDVMEQFALMSDEEMEEAFSEVVKMLGGEDDPEIALAVKEIMGAVKSMDGDDVMDSKTAFDEDSIAEATDIALEMISKSDWEVIYKKRFEVLHSLILSGKVSVEEAELYTDDSNAWEKELRSIWDGLQIQAEGNGNVIAKDEL